MKTLLVYMSQDMHSHELTLHKQYTSREPGSDVLIPDYIEQYRTHFKDKRCSKLHIVVVELTMTGATIVMNEWMEHPLKTKIIINKAAKTASGNKTSANLQSLLEGLPPPVMTSYSAPTNFDSTFTGAA